MSGRAAAARDGIGPGIGAGIVTGLVTGSAALLAAAAAVAGALVAMGIPLREGLSLMLEGAMAGPGQPAAALRHATPILLVGLGVGLALRAGFWNLGAAGQAVAGALAATAAAALAAPSAALMLTAAALGGAAAMAVPAVLRVRAGTDEALVTLLMAVALARLAPAWASPSPAGPPIADPVASALLAMALAVGLWLATAGTTAGLMLRATGANPAAARRAGLPVDAVIAAAAMASGALAGLAGGMLAAAPEVGAIAGVAHAGVAVALMARRWPPGLLPAALLAGVAFSGAEHLAAGLGRPALHGDFVIAAALIGALAGGALARRAR